MFNLAHKTRGSQVAGVPYCFHFAPGDVWIFQTKARFQGTRWWMGKDSRKTLRKKYGSQEFFIILGTRMVQYTVGKYSIAGWILDQTAISKMVFLFTSRSLPLPYRGPGHLRRKCFFFPMLFGWSPTQPQGVFTWLSYKQLRPVMNLQES